MAAIGTSGNDTLSGSNLILGLGGSDSLTSISSEGFLDGGVGNDTLTVNYNENSTQFYGTHRWHLIGGNGDDSLQVTTDITNDGNALDIAPIVVADGGQGDDTISILHDIDMFDITFTSFPKINASTTVIDKSGDNLISVGHDLYTTDSVLSASTTIVTGGGADNVTISDSGDADNFVANFDHYLELGGGDDTLSLNAISGDMRSVVYAGNGNDSLDTTFIGNEGNDNGILWDILQDTGAGNDTVTADFSAGGFGGLEASYVNAIFNLGGGNDNLNLETSLFGVYFVDAGQGTNVVAIKFDGDEAPFSSEAVVDVKGGGGKDSVTIEGFKNPFTLDEMVTTYIDTGFGNDTITVTETGSNTIDAGDNNDLIYVDSIHDPLGSDRINLVDGGNGNDTITVLDQMGVSAHYRYNDVMGGSGNDEIISEIAGNGEHRVTGDGGKDNIKILGDFANAIIDGGTGSDTILSSSGHDNIFGGGGNDFILGGLGNDSLTGGTGTDTFIFDAPGIGEGDDVIFDWNQAVDRLDVNLVDANGNGLVDEFDAQISSVSQGGGDILVKFKAGGSITFKGGDPGVPFTSIAVMMDDPLMQLV